MFQEIKKVTCKSPRNCEGGHSNKCYICPFRKLSPYNGSEWQVKCSRVGTFSEYWNPKILLQKKMFHKSFLVLTLNFDASDYFDIRNWSVIKTICPPYLEDVSSVDLISRKEKPTPSLNLAIVWCYMKM